jgi:hypothetical protein
MRASGRGLGKRVSGLESPENKVQNRKLKDSVKSVFGPIGCRWLKIWELPNVKNPAGVV